MAEWLKAPVLKTGEGQTSVGSNPTLSAKRRHTPMGCVFLLAWIFVKWDSKGGTWQQSGGLLQPPWLFRRKGIPLSNK